MEKGSNGIIGKQVLIIFEDGANFHVSKKIGICTDHNDVEFIINNKHIIPKHRVIRVEVLKC